MIRLDLTDIKVLIFDFGGVIINLCMDNSIQKLHDLGIYDAEKLLDNYVQSGLFLELESGAINASQFRNELRKDYSLKDISDELIDDAFLAFLRDIPQEKLNLLRRLHSGVKNKCGDRIRIVMLSNTNEIHFPYCVKTFFERNGYTMQDYFDRLYLSYEMKMSKPSDEIFLKLLEEEGVQPSDCMFLDDSPKNIEAASRLGFHTYLVSPHENLMPLFDI